MRVAPVTLLVVLLLFPAALRAQEEGPAPVDARGRMLMEIIDTLERDLEELGRKRREFNRQKETLEQQLALLQEQISRADRKLKESKKQIEKLLRSVVLMKEPDDLLLYFSTMRYHDLHVYRRAIRKITLSLSRKLSGLVETKKTLDRQKAALLHQAETFQSRRDALLAEIEKVEKVATRTRTELTERTRKIAAIESLFMTADFDSPYVEAGPGGAGVGPVPGDLGEHRRKADLQIPVSPGKLIKGFEEMPEAPYGTEKMVRGWLIVPFMKGKKKEATDTAFVRAPFLGTVVFLGEVPGFGLTVVVDHGHGYHTVYSNLYRTQVAKGDVLEQDGVLGTIRSLGGDVLPYLYFEMRQNRIAVDPKPWFLLRPLQPGERAL